ncbi:ribbon-helix-helix domain-containing protein [Campylobacter avium]|uniref:ribbon-helix-helix domain-containing protein n=1 Tax=Campylobacter avium TaxID=522485 RepID=UPI00255BC9DE|nr:ribbon-helix-helix domain-containing protein [Campylobacter avium]
MKSKGLSSIDEALKKEATKQRTYIGVENSNAGRKKINDKMLAISFYLEQEEYDKLLEAMQDEFEKNRSHFIRKIVLKYLRDIKK